MPKLTYHNLGNADCCRMDLDGGQTLLFDYADRRCHDDPTDKRADLPSVLKKELKAAGRNGYDVVGITHLDDDHIAGFSAFFELDHAAKYQGAERVTITELWVPAAVIFEEACDDEARIVQAEARFRLRQGKGIRVFSRPTLLCDWLKEQGLTVESRAHLITDAGTLVPGWTLDGHGVEFFIHSPFASRLADGSLMDRNKDSLCFQATFQVYHQLTRVLMTADVEHEVLSEIVRVTRYKNNDDRLKWDVYKLPHHCSYTAIGPEKGDDKTEPVPNVRWLCEQGQRGAIIIATSNPIPAKGTVEDECAQPPHRQAANYYKHDVLQPIDGEFRVTMEHPTVGKPQPLVIEITGMGAQIEKKVLGGAATAINAPAPRAG